MRLFLVCRENGRLRFLSCYSQHLGDFAERYKTALEDRGCEVHVGLFVDLADAMRAHPSWFEDDARAADAGQRKAA